jgi:nucleotide-binding universal stress UspA family protein
MFTTILVASDGSDAVDLLVTVARSIARPGATKVIVAYVNELMAGRSGGQTAQDDEDSFKRKVRLHVASLRAAGVNAQAQLRSTTGKGANSIAEMARECHADLIIAGPGPHRLIADRVFGTAGERMIERAPCSVLVVPPRN